MLNGASSAGTAGRPVVVATPTPDILPPERDVAAAAASVRAAHPATGTVIDAWLAGDVAKVVPAFPSVAGPCEQFVTRGVTRCERAGLARGTTIELYQRSSESAPGFQIERQDVDDTVRYLVVGRSPRLELLATRQDDGAYLVVIGVDPKPGLQFPGPLEEGGAPVVSLYVVLDGAGKILDLATKTGGSPPLEDLRYEMRHG